ncbi:hypothetical protein L1987_78005 [Smallanthus sonchifolius]|uniref:Uncharacterized protein n=1 Tax=Smallanthus sonchifolius TaxID=185202 RepID=A0ACB8ZAK0_9ASTR|nr:hypothetical protein L1987_78005 [Smallanthus sonchifolius]
MIIHFVTVDPIFDYHQIRQIPVIPSRIETLQSLNEPPEAFTQTRLTGEVAERAGDQTSAVGTDFSRPPQSRHQFRAFVSLLRLTHVAPTFPLCDSNPYSSSAKCNMLSQKVLILFRTVNMDLSEDAKLRHRIMSSTPPPSPNASGHKAHVPSSPEPKRRRTTSIEQGKPSNARALEYALN